MTTQRHSAALRRGLFAGLVALALSISGLGAGSATAAQRSFSYEQTVPVPLSRVCAETSRTPRQCTPGAQNVHIRLNASAVADGTGTGVTVLGNCVRADLALLAGATANILVETTGSGLSTLANATIAAGSAPVREFALVCVE